MYEGPKLIMSGRPQGLGSGLCDFAQVVLFSCPFEFGLWLCCIRFSSEISLLTVCRMHTCLGAFRTSLVASLHVEAGELLLELRRQQLCLQYICKLRSNATLLSMVYLVLASDACLRLDQIPYPHLVSD